jgi:hypothetical protein
MHLFNAVYEQIVQMLALSIKLDQMLDWVSGEMYCYLPRYTVLLHPYLGALIVIWRM